MSAQRSIQSTVTVILGCIWLTHVGNVFGDWPQFRGPDGQGHSDSANVPVEWSEQKNIAWKSAIPGAGLSSPVTAGNQIWLTTAEKEGKSLRAVCFDKTSGKLIHNIEVFTPSVVGPKHTTNGYASPTPVLDGRHVYVHFGPRGTACLDTSGKVVWRNQEFKYNAFQGAASSPILHGDLLILTCDGTDNQFIAALDKRTGKSKWVQKRAHLERAAKKVKIAKMAYSTPLVQNINGMDQLVSTGADHVAAYNINNGKELWWMPYNGFSLVSRPSYGHGLFYVVGSVSQDHFCIYAVRPGSGQLRDEQIVWQRSKGLAHVPSPLLVGSEIYLIDRSGVATCVDALTGKERWRERIGGNYDASPIEIRGRVYYTSREGKTTVLQAGPTFQKLAVNQLDGEIRASAAVDDGAIFLRSDSHLYCVKSQ